MSASRRFTNSSQGGISGNHVPARRTCPLRHRQVYLSARDRARLAPTIIDGRVAIDPSTLKIGQIIRLCRTNKIYVAEARDQKSATSANVMTRLSP